MKILKFTISASIIALLLGCATPPPAAPVYATPFPAEEYEQFSKTGTASIIGQAFLKTRGGDIKTCAGESVFLTRATDYFTQFWMDGGPFNPGVYEPKMSDQMSPRLKEYTLSTVADADGRFKFRNVPAGRFYVFTNVRWMAGYVPQGGYLLQEITVQEGREHELTMND